MSHLDKFYTKIHVVTRCWDIFDSYVSPDRNLMYIEPSAGSGAFLRHDRRIQGYDISPDDERIIRADFLNFEFKDISTTDIAIIGNPPFGSQSKLAFAFLKNHLR